MEETGQPYLVALVLYAQQLPSQPLQNEVKLSHFSEVYFTLSIKTAIDSQYSI